MKKSIILYRIGAIVFILLGLLHLMAHFTMPDDNSLNELLKDMEDYKIEMMGEHNLLKFYMGFSIMMGFLLTALGLVNFIFSKSITKGSIYTNVLISAIGFIIAFNYFHVLAYGFIFIALISYSCSLIFYKKAVS